MNYNNFVKKRFEVLLKEEKVLVSNNIAQAEFSNPLTNLEWNILFYSMFKLNNSNKNQINFKMSEFCLDAGVEISNYLNVFKYNITNLQKIIISTYNPKYNIYKNQNIIYESLYNSNNHNIEIKFNPDLINEFNKLTKNYTYQDFKNFISFNSKYSKRMYMYFRSKYHPNNFENFQDIEIKKLKSLLGIKSDEYSKISHLKDIVIKAIQKDINKYCDEFNLSYEDIKSSKKITGFKFHIIPKNSYQETIKNSLTNVQIDNYNLNYTQYFKNTFNRSLTAEENIAIEPYLEKINNDVINFVIFQIAQKQKHFAINYLVKIFDTLIAKNINNDIAKVQKFYEQWNNKDKE